MRHPMHDVFTRLRMLRLSERLTQAQLAIDLGVSRKTINELELGKRQLSLTFARKCANYFGLSLDAILSA